MSSIGGGGGINFGGGLGSVNLGSNSSGMTMQIMSQAPGWDAFKNFLGKKGFDKFLQTLGQMIDQQINQEKQKAVKAAQNLKLAEEGKPTNPG